MFSQKNRPPCLWAQTERSDGSVYENHCHCSTINMELQGKEGIMMWGTERWKALDLRRRSTLGPYDDELLVLHMIPKTDARSERYLVGRMEVCRGRTCFTGSGGRLAPAELRKHYDLRWIRLKEDGGGNQWPE